MNPLVCSSQPSGRQQCVHGGYQQCGPVGVGLDQRVGHLGEEVQQNLVRPVGELEPWIVENPVVVPVEVGDTVPDDVLSCGRVARIGRRQRVQVVELPQGAGLAQAPPPRPRLCPQEIEDVPPSDCGDRAGLGRGGAGRRLCHRNRMASGTDTRTGESAGPHAMPLSLS